MNRDEMTKLLEAQFAKFAGQITTHVDERIRGLEGRIDERFERLETMVDAIAERVAADEQERAAITAEQRRHRGWIKQLAKHTGAKLAPRGKGI